MVIWYQQEKGWAKPDLNGDSALARSRRQHCINLAHLTPGSSGVQASAVMVRVSHLGISGGPHPNASRSAHRTHRTTMTDHELYETTPQEALDRYLSDRESEVSKATLKSHEYRLNHFVRWCKQEGIENINVLNGRALQDYRFWRKQDGNLNNVSLHTQMTTFRVFIKWAEDFNAVVPRLHEKVRVPDMERDEDVSDRKIKPERALKVLDYLDKYHYATRRHAMFRLMFRAGLRMGGIRTLDLEDYNSEEQFIEVVHRPDTETPLKTKRKDSGQSI